MSHARNPSSHSLFNSGASSTGGGREKTYFEQQRELLIVEIATSFEHVLANVNKLNRGLEATIAVGNEFSSVEALWSQFENVMAQKQEEKQQQQAPEGNQSREAQSQAHEGEEEDEDEHMRGEEREER